MSTYYVDIICRHNALLRGWVSESRSPVSHLQRGNQQGKEGGRQGRLGDCREVCGDCECEVCDWRRQGQGGGSKDNLGGSL